MEKYAFLPFTFFLAVFWIFTYFKVPETKNRTFEEISALFRKDDLIQIDDVQYSHSHKSSSGDIYSHKSSSGDIIFTDERTLEKCKQPLQQQQQQTLCSSSANGNNGNTAMLLYDQPQHAHHLHARHSREPSRTGSVSHSELTTEGVSPSTPANATQ